MFAAVGAPRIEAEATLALVHSRRVIHSQRRSRGYCRLIDNAEGDNFGGGCYATSTRWPDNGLHFSHVFGVAKSLNTIVACSPAGIALTLPLLNTMVTYSISPLHTAAMCAVDGWKSSCKKTCEHCLSGYQASRIRRYPRTPSLAQDQLTLSTHRITRHVEKWGALPEQFSRLHRE